MVGGAISGAGESVSLILYLETGFSVSLHAVASVEAGDVVSGVDG
jgi:hypothetical protein